MARYVKLDMTNNGTILQTSGFKPDKYRQGYIEVVPPLGSQGIVLDRDQIVFEDDLPELNDLQYDLWHFQSWVDGVRKGYKIIKY